MDGWMCSKEESFVVELLVSSSFYLYRYPFRYPVDSSELWGPLCDKWRTRSLQWWRSNELMSMSGNYLHASENVKNYFQMVDSLQDSGRNPSDIPEGILRGLRKESSQNMRPNLSKISKINQDSVGNISWIPCRVFPKFHWIFPRFRKKNLLKFP